MAFLSATDRLVVGTGIANIHVRIPSAAETGGRTLNALFQGGSSSASASVTPRSSHGLGGTYTKPLATMASYLDRMAAVSDAIEPGAGRPSGCWPPSAPR